MLTAAAPVSSAKWRVMIDREAALVAPAIERNSTPYCGEAPKGDSVVDLLARLLDDHQRVEPHHTHCCELCMAATSGIAALLVAQGAYSTEPIQHIHGGGK